MPDGYVIVLPDSTGKKIDASELTRADGTVVERQRVVIGDPEDPTDTLSLDSLRSDRRAAEIQQIEATEASINGLVTRGGCERPFSLDRRGGSTGRGALR